MLINAYFRRRAPIVQEGNFNLISYGESDGSADFDLEFMYPIIVVQDSTLADETGTFITDELGEVVLVDAD